MAFQDQPVVALPEQERFLMTPGILRAVTEMEKQFLTSAQ